MLFTVLTAAVLAQASASTVLTLDQALAQAAERNQDIKAAEARLDQARANAGKARSGQLPHVGVGGNYMYNSVEARIAMPTGYYIRDVGVPYGPGPHDPSRPDSPENPPGFPAPYVMYPAGFMEATVQRHHQLGGQLQASQGLIMPQVWAAMDNAKKAIRLSDLSLEAARREVLFAVASMYYSAAGLREAVQVQQQLLEVNQAHEKDATIQVSTGMAPRLVQLRAQIERTRAEQDVLRARNAYASTISALATLLDREPDFDVVRPAPIATPTAASQRDPEALTATALSARPDLQASHVAVDLAEGTRRGVLAKYAPTVSLVGQYNLANVQGFAGAYGVWGGGVALQWNLFDGGLREAELREASARIAESEAGLRAAEARVRDEVRRALLELESADANRIKAEQQARLARENARLVKQSFEAGVSTHIEVVDANGALSGAELSRVSETLNADLAALRLARAIGAYAPTAETTPTTTAETR